MALIVSATSGNFNSTATWVGGVVPGIGDEAQASTGHTVQITADANCTLVSNVGSGTFVLNAGVTLTADITNKSSTANSNCVQFTANSPAVGYIVGNITGSSFSQASSTPSTAIINSGSGTLTVTGSIFGGTNNFCYGARNNSSGTLVFTGNALAGTASGAHALVNNSTGTIQMTGNATGGGNTATYGLHNVTTGVIICVGSVIGGSNGNGAVNASTGTIRLTRAVGNAYGPGNTAGLASSVGAANSSLGVIEIEQLEFGAYGQSPVSGTGIRLKKANTNAAVFNYCDTAGAKTLVDATQGQMPAVTDVRSGVSYASGALTGTCAVPPAASVAVGVPVDATVGTAALTASDIRSAIGLASANLDSQLATIPTASQNATQVRTELTQELTQITETHLIHGLKAGSPLNVTPTARTAGAISQTITGDGVTTTTVTR